jgi:hypothetical protein
LIVNIFSFEDVNELNEESWFFWKDIFFPRLLERKCC